jgi:hypothetical protein
MTDQQETQEQLTTLRKLYLKYTLNPVMKDKISDIIEYLERELEIIERVESHVREFSGTDQADKKPAINYP